MGTKSKDQVGSLELTLSSLQAVLYGKKNKNQARGAKPSPKLTNSREFNESLDSDSVSADDFEKAS